MEDEQIKVYFSVSGWSRGTDPGEVVEPWEERKPYCVIEIIFYSIPSV